MVIIVFLIVLGIFLAIPVALLVVMLQKKAAREAHAMLEAGRITDERKFKSISRTLGSMRDAQSTDLYRRLQDMKYARPKG